MAAARGGSGAATAPPYGSGTLADLMPAVLRSPDVEGSDVEAPGAATADGLRFAPTARACVLLVGGLGDLLLRERAGHAPYLRGRLDAVGSLDVGFPTTTATSMGSFGTGLPPGSHGLVGYEVLVPGRDELLNELSWETPVDPRTWQPHPTAFEQALAAGVEVVRVGPGFFDGSGLTEAALRGGRFVAASTLDARVDAALAALRSAPRTLVYVYWGDVDKVGHVHGCGSWEWGEELAAVDLAVRRLVAGLPRDATLHVTADHGMVDVPHAQRLDVGAEPDLAAGVRHVGGEPRAPQLYCEDGSAESVARAWADRLGHRADVLTREQAIAAGWFGAVAPHVLHRIGDVVVSCGTDLAVVDSRHHRPELLALVGLHGARTPAEWRVPLLTVAGSGRG
jgi:Type I phosphodiesterase / nucleotide pyrophosphatase